MAPTADDVILAVMTWKRCTSGSLLDLWPLRTPEDVLGLRSLVAVQLSASRSDGLGAAVAVAPAILWMDHTVDLAVESYSTRSTISRGSFEFAWFCFESPMLVDMRDRHGESRGGGLALGAMIHCMEDGISVDSIVSVGGGLDVFDINTRFVPYGTEPSGHLPDFAYEGKDIPALGMADMISLELMSFLSSPYIPKVHERINGRLRKTLRKAGWTERPSDMVTFIDLRSPVDSKETADGGSRRWHCRWMVRGHVRNQWFPKAKKHHPVWVPTHVKGPADKPIKVGVHRVVR